MKASRFALCAVVVTAVFACPSLNTAHAAGHGSKWNRYQSNTPVDVANLTFSITLR